MVQITLLRVIAFLLISVLAFFIDLARPPPFPAADYWLIFGINMGFALLAWLAMRMLCQRVGKFSLTSMFFHLDLLV